MWCENECNILDEQSALSSSHNSLCIILAYLYSVIVVCFIRTIETATLIPSSKGGADVIAYYSLGNIYNRENMPMEINHE